jgi:type I restriction enzyme S subunit
MGVKPGYKQTEVGVIPEDWEIETLESLGSLKNGINKSKQDFGHGNSFVNLMDVFGVRKITSSQQLGLVKTFLEERKNYSLKSGDVLFIRSSVKPEGVGLTALVANDLIDTVYSGFLIRFRNNGRLSPAFLEYCFSSRYFRDAIIENSTVSANTNINQVALRKLRLVYPVEYQEQQAIAAALSDVDALIAAQEALVAKKRAIKQGAMQELLTGRKRLLGFEGKQAGEVSGLIDMSPQRNRSAACKMYNFIGMEDVSEVGRITKQNEMIADEVRSGLTYFERQDVLVAKITPCFENGKGASLDEMKHASGFGSTEFHVLRANRSSDQRYLFYQTQMGEFRRRLADEMVGSAGHRRVPIKALLSYPLPIIPTLPEQQAIATVLSDMDAEIEALQSQVRKTQALKQGMMQELLTGRIRLV